MVPSEVDIHWRMPSDYPLMDGLGRLIVDKRIPCPNGCGVGAYHSEFARGLEIVKLYHCHRCLKFFAVKEVLS